MYYLLGISLLLAFLLIINLLVAACVSALWRPISARTGKMSPHAVSELILGLRLLPVAVSIVFVAVFLLPAYVLYEPHESGEVVSGKLALVALAAMFGIGFAGFRVVRTWWATRRLMANWLRSSLEINVDEIGVPVHLIDHPFPVIAVAGVFRPRMFVARKVLDGLSESEFEAAVAHECWHLAAQDNLKRTLLRACRDLLVLPIGTTIDRAWSDNAESMADEYAATTRGRSTALDLASALVKIARMVPAGTGPAMPVGAFLIEQDAGDISHRVKRLVSLSEDSLEPQPGKWSATSLLTWLSAGLLAGMLTLAVIVPGIFPTLHSGIEVVVNAIQ